MAYNSFRKFRPGANRHLKPISDNAVAVAKSKGLLNAARKCEDCNGLFGHPKIGRPIAHHEDYANPLDVNWLCDFCHKTRHYGTWDERCEQQVVSIRVGKETYELLKTAAVEEDVCLSDMGRKLIEIGLATLSANGVIHSVPQEQNHASQ